MNERVKRLRQLLNINQAEFGARLGVTSATISRIESGERAITEQMALSISREFSVNSEWLRKGVGVVFKNKDSMETEQFYAKNGLDDMDRRIFEAYIALPESKRRVFKEFVLRIALVNSEFPEQQPTPSLLWKKP